MSKINRPDSDPCIILINDNVGFMMNHYENSKKARRVASVTYLIIMAVILGGTFLSNQQKELSKKQSSHIWTPRLLQVSFHN
jgi:hypothetical protein